MTVFWCVFGSNLAWCTTLRVSFEKVSVCVCGGGGDSPELRPCMSRIISGLINFYDAPGSDFGRTWAPQISWTVTMAVTWLQWAQLECLEFTKCVSRLWKNSLVSSAIKHQHGITTLENRETGKLNAMLIHFRNLLMGTYARKTQPITNKPQHFEIHFVKWHHSHY